MENLEKMSKKIEDETLKEIDAELQEIKGDISIGNQLARLPEPVFKNIFLPYLTGKIPLDRNNIIFAKWVEFAGSPFLGVHIVDKDNNILFTTPPLLEPLKFDGEISNMGIVAEEYEERRKRLPGEGEKFLDDVFGSICEGLISDPTNSIKGWKEIAEYYSTIDSNEEVPAEIPETIANDIDGIEDDIIYY